MKPDFSGHWVLNRPACILSPGADAISRAEVRIDHRDPTFGCRAEFVSENDSKKFEYETQADAPEVRSTHEGMTMVSSLRWKGDSLTVRWYTQGPDGEMDMSFRHELIDEGRRLRIQEQLRSSGHNQDNTWIFDRR